MTAASLFMNAETRRAVASGEVIDAEGDNGAHMYGVVSGAVELRKGTTTVARLGPGDVFGERALVDHLPRNLTATATAPTELAEIDQARFLFLVHETPTFALEIMAALAARLRDYDDWLGSRTG